jgi:hypothetical protein
MKTLFLSLILSLGFSLVQAQNNNAGSSRAETLAHELCDCITNYFQDMHPAIQAYLDDLTELGEAEAVRRFSEKIQKLSAEEQERVQQDAQRMQDVGNDPAFTRCAQLVQNAIMNDKEALAFQNYIMKAPACALMRTFMLLGQTAEEAQDE